MPSVQTKSFLTSKTIWSAIVGFVAVLVLPWFKIEVPVEEQEQLTNTLLDAGTAISAILGFIGVWYGRATADTPITVTSKTVYKAPAWLLAATMTLGSSWAPLAAGTALAATACVATGCAADARTQWSQAREGLTFANNTIVDAHESGLIGDEELVVMGEAAQAARAALEHAETYLVLNDQGQWVVSPGAGGAFEQYMGIVRAVLVRVAQLQADTE